MSLDIKSSLDAIKRQALLVIMKSVKVPFVNISNDLFSYITIDGSSFNTLLDRLDFNPAVFSSTQMSAVYLLAYLDFYALYTIMVSNYTVFNQLKTVSEGKYRYIYNLYKELDRVIGTKGIMQDYAYGFYNNFLYPKDINAASSRVITRSGKLTNILDTYPVLTLPVKTSKEVFPTSLTFSTDDQSLSEVETSDDTSYLNYSIFRYQNNKISRVSRIEPAKDGIIYSRMTPDVTGVIAGYFTDTIYINITESSRDANDQPVIKMQCSTNSADWSSDTEVVAGEPTSIKIEGDIEIGLYVTFYDGCSLTTGDRWLLTIASGAIAYPSIEMVIKFGMLEPVSFISYMDISPHKLDVISSIVRPRRFENYQYNAKVFDGRIGHIAVTNGQINTYRTTLSQSNFDIISRDGRLANKYDFKITDIKGYQNTYEPHGAITFNPVAVENITSAALESDNYLGEYGIWEAESNTDVKLPQSFIEYNLVAETTMSRAVVPILPKNLLKRFNVNLVAFYSHLSLLSVSNGDLAVVFLDADSSKCGTYIYADDNTWKLWSKDTSGYTPIIIESVVPSRIDITNELLSYGSALYTPRFPADTDYVINDTNPYPHMQAYDNYLKSEASYTYDVTANSLLFGQYYWKNGYTVVYPVKLWSISDTADNDYNNGKWIQASAGIYYMYYVDEYNDVHLALREYDQGSQILRSFTGNLYGQVEMRSMDKSYVTPMVFDYKLEYI